MQQLQAIKIILVRHGETEANRLRRFSESNDVPLTATGVRQAQELALLLAQRFRPELVVSSPFLRARQTAQAIAGTLGLNVEVLDGIYERDFGSLAGQAYERMGELMLSDSAYDPETFWMWAPPEGESLDAVRQRAILALETLRQRGLSETVVVCHGAVIQSVCAHITGEWRESFVPPNCGFSVIEYESGNWKQPLISAPWQAL